MSHDNDCMVWEHQPAGEDGWRECTCKVFNPTHDPLCKFSKRKAADDHYDDGCDYCDLIAKVRADEARMAANRICFVDVVARGEVYEDAWIRRNDAIMEAGRGEDVGFLRQFGLEPTREDYDRQRAIAAELTRMAQEDGFIP